MVKRKDCYEILGISRNADEAAIKKAYRKLAKKYHPDTNPGDSRAEEQFKEVSEAYNILSDKEKKKLYDQYGYAAFDESGNPRPEGWYGQGGQFYGNGPFRQAGDDKRNYQYREFHFNPGGQGQGDIDLDDLFGSIFGGGKGSYDRGREGFGGFGGFQGRQGGRQRQDFSQKGQDVQAQIQISLREAAAGCDRMIEYVDHTGSKQTLKVHIPAGIASGGKVRLAGKGYPGRNGGKTGDLLLEVQVEEDPVFERKGNDVYTTVRVPYSVMILGGEVTVPTLHGPVKCKIREGTNAGSRIRLKGKGMPSVRKKGNPGDQYVTVEVRTPGKVSEETRRKLRECAGEGV